MNCILGVHDRGSLEKLFWNRLLIFRQMSSTLWVWGRACCFSYEKLIAFSCVICFGEEKTKNISQSAHGGESLVNALMSPLEWCIAVALIPKARECISSLNFPNDSHGTMILGRWWKSCLSFLQSWWLQFWWCPEGREGGVPSNFKCRRTAGSWIWGRRQQKEQLDTSVAWEDKGGSEDQQEAWDLKYYCKWEGNCTCEKARQLSLLMGCGISGW